MAQELEWKDDWTVADVFNWLDIAEDHLNASDYLWLKERFVSADESLLNSEKGQVYIDSDGVPRPYSDHVNTLHNVVRDVFEAANGDVPKF